MRCELALPFFKRAVVSIVEGGLEFVSVHVGQTVFGTGGNAPPAGASAVIVAAVVAS